MTNEKNESQRNILRIRKSQSALIFYLNIYIFCVLNSVKGSVNVCFIIWQGKTNDFKFILLIIYSPSSKNIRVPHPPPTQRLLLVDFDWQYIYTQICRLQKHRETHKHNKFEKIIIIQSIKNLWIQTKKKK